MRDDWDDDDLYDNDEDGLYDDEILDEEDWDDDDPLADDEFYDTIYDEFDQVEADEVLVSLKKYEAMEDVLKSTYFKNIGIISVCFGEGIKKAFMELGTDYIIDGGQTMNPSTEQFLEAMKN